MMLFYLFSGAGHRIGLCEVMLSGQSTKWLNDHLLFRELNQKKKLPKKKKQKKDVEESDSGKVYDIES